MESNQTIPIDTQIATPIIYRIQDNTEMTLIVIFFILVFVVYGFIICLACRRAKISELTNEINNYKKMPISIVSSDYKI